MGAGLLAYFGIILERDARGLDYWGGGNGHTV